MSASEVSEGTEYGISSCLSRGPILPDHTIKPRTNALNMFTEQALNIVACLLGDVCRGVQTL